VQPRHHRRQAAEEFGDRRDRRYRHAASHPKSGIDLVAVALGYRFKQARATSRIEETADVRKLLHAG
jgi:hypothetical protein